MRPQSIIWFERFYVAALLLGLISAAQTWSLQAAMLNSDPRLVRMAWLPYASLALRIVLAVALWYFVVRKGSAVAKWIVVALAAYGGVLLVMLVFGSITGSARLDIVIPSALQNIFYIAAAAMLCRADARPWFDRRAPVESVA